MSKNHETEEEEDEDEVNKRSGMRRGMDGRIRAQVPKDVRAASLLIS